MYPALSVLKAIPTDALTTLWVGGEGGMEADLVKRAGVPFTTIPAGGVHGVGVFNLLRNLWNLTRGVFAARRVIKQFRPDVLFFTGGYLAAPMAVAGWSVPSVLYVPDIEPGMALNFLARFAEIIALTAEESKAYFSKSKARLVVTGYPTRPDLGQWDHAAAARKFNLDPDQPILLVWGGSKGARSINRALISILPEVLTFTQVIHISGSLDWNEVQAAAQSLPTDLAGRYSANAYVHEMGAALAAADLSISRAGASSLGEYPLFGLPAVLVPYPYAWRYQKVNADHLTSRGAAVMLKDESLSEQLLPTLKDLFAEPSRLDQMRSAMRALAMPDAASKIAALIDEMGNSTRKGNADR